MKKLRKKIIQILSALTHIYWYIFGALIALFTIALILFQTKILTHEWLLEKIAWINQEPIVTVSTFTTILSGLIVGQIIIFYLRKLLSNLVEEKVFTSDNVKIIRTIAAISIIASIIRWDFSAALSNWVLIAFSEIFAYGVTLEEEKKLTI